MSWQTINKTGLSPDLTWNHEADHETHGAGEENDPDDSLDDVPAILGDVLEAVQGGLGTVTLPLLPQSQHHKLLEDRHWTIF